MGLRTRVFFVVCAVAFLALNVRLFIRLSRYAPFNMSRHAVFPSSMDEVAGTSSVYLWCKDQVASCRERSVEEQCKSNATIREHLCKEACGTCDVLARTVARDVGTEVLFLKEPYQFFCKDVRLDCSIPGFEKQCATHSPEVVAGCKASCNFCNASSFAGSNPLLQCADYASLCPFWASGGRCKQSKSKSWMSKLCRASCALCDQSEVEKDRHVVPLAFLRSVAVASDCKDFHLDCAGWRDMGACSRQRDFMMVHCAYSCGLCKSRGDAEPTPGTDAINLNIRFSKVNDAPQEWYSVVRPPGPLVSSYLFQPLEDQFCPTLHTRCKEWANQRQCDQNFAFMLATCPSHCGLCRTVWRRAIPPVVHIRGGLAMPTVGLGTAGMGAATAKAVTAALELGYRHIDTAQAEEWYREDLVGRALKESSTPRNQLFITTKMHPRHHGFESTVRQVNKSLERLHTKYIDLFLLHYPECWGTLCGDVKPQGTWKDSWKALEHLKSTGKILAIGVSNFDAEQLVELLNIATEPPAVLQAHSDPLSPNWLLQALCRRNGIVFVAYSSLGTQWLRGDQHTNPVLTNSVIERLAKAYNRSAAQVVLMWSLQHGQVVIPRSTNEVHLKENINLDFTLAKKDLLEIDHISARKASSQQ